VLILLSSKYLEPIKYFIDKEENLSNLKVNLFAVPIGISFYALQAISLLVDIYNAKYKSELSLKNTALFLCFFPQSLAGPIHRAHELIPQFSHYKPIDVYKIITGFKNLLFGFFCKLIIADKIAIVISPIFSKWSEADGLSLFIATLLYSLQIYFDFWGYSLIAIGLGRILGFNIKTNFNHPYMALTFRDFWHRWHISLSQWMRDYIYIPLGGRKKGYTYFGVAIFTTFVISGLWHGLTYNFLLWGVIHALLYLLEAVLLKRKTVLHVGSNVAAVIRIIRRVIFFIVISITWLVFRIEELPVLQDIIKNILHFEGWSLEVAYSYFLTDVNVIYITIILTTFLLSSTSFIKRKLNSVPITNYGRFSDSLFICTCLFCVIILGDIGTQEFLYFRF